MTAKLKQPARAEARRRANERKEFKRRAAKKAARRGVTTPTKAERRANAVSRNNVIWAANVFQSNRLAKKLTSIVMKQLEAREQAA